ncbi:MAG: hypothetical protein A2Z14_10495 [Chloroflexi bacterium RBG_16_48_8]|nr:MAG: hypothetical protein A2Z14_10495 [Chloroflexi bacterium RBG_16_48_8]
MRNKKIAILLVTFVLLLVTVIPVAAITWGEPDNGEHPHVGTLLFVQNGVGYYSCTGTMIAPSVMLTAGHCVEENGNINDVTYVRFAEDAMASYGDYSSTQEWLNKEWLAVKTVIPHPKFDDYAKFPMTYDVGVVILKKPYYPKDSNGNFVFGELPELYFLEGLTGVEKNHFTVVGYGMQGTLPPFYQDDYARYKGIVKLLEVSSYLTAGGEANAKFSNNQGIGGGTCYGDSGGPTFFKDTNLIVAVTSFGWAKNGNCIGNDYNYRMDIPDALDFLYDILNKYSGKR